jgi:hypothetical protein
MKSPIDAAVLTSRSARGRERRTTTADATINDLVRHRATELARDWK